MFVHRTPNSLLPPGLAFIPNTSFTPQDMHFGLDSGEQPYMSMRTGPKHTQQVSHY